MKTLNTCCKDTIVHEIRSEFYITSIESEKTDLSQVYDMMNEVDVILDDSVWIPLVESTTR